MFLITKSQELLFELLRISTGAKTTLLRAYTDKEWEGAYKLAEEHTITGVLLDALCVVQEERPDLMPSRMLLLQWIGMGQIIETETKHLEVAGKIVVDYFHKKGFVCQILKGCAVGRYYPHPFRRLSGDIDIWLGGGRKKIYDFARAYDKDGKLYGVNYHHIHFHFFENIHLELHIWPSFLSSPLRNWRLHKFFNLYNPTMEASMPSPAFDRVFILLHCFRHFCGSGVGLRQVMDYFYVLRQGFTEEERNETVYWIRQLGMTRFAKGIMWVLKQSFGLENKYLIMDLQRKKGVLL